METALCERVGVQGEIRDPGQFPGTASQRNEFSEEQHFP